MHALCRAGTGVRRRPRCARPLGGVRPCPWPAATCGVADREMDAAAALARTPARLQREEGLLPGPGDRRAHAFPRPGQARAGAVRMRRAARGGTAGHGRSEEHTSELQSLMRISYAVLCL